jgi:hypothetical protein
MSDEVVPFDDGFNNDDNAKDQDHRLRGFYLKWNDQTGWRDSDGLAPPPIMLVFGITEFLQRWKNNVPEKILTKPLPDPDELNQKIPVAEWEMGLDGKPRPPWEHTVGVCFINLATGQKYLYSAATSGAHIAYDNLKDAVLTMRALRGSRVLPLVKLSQRLFKTKFGMKTRPDLEIIDWKQPGSPDTLPSQTPPAQLPGPATTAAAPPTTTPAAEREPRPHPRQPKPAISVAAGTISAMSTVEPVSPAEEMNDELPW